MDSLDTMLTDPLDLGPCLDSNGARIMEPCLLGGTRVSLPEDLLEDVSTISVYNSHTLLYISSFCALNATAFVEWYLLCRVVENSAGDGSKNTCLIC
ncbi:hypothetical protein GDO81_013890 [Engystomops pustulosus]|uniref:Uncharacterized protein n=1 Tax=Engystomops pustulosus TaxID=76066 RepID=A0AAV7B6G2_ENGPU|nr:hypothetical protein GDO81_013890 [Engystomops pustulosus]